MVPEEIQKLHTLLCSGMGLSGGCDQLSELLPTRSRIAAVTVPPAVSVKDMPSYDPDAEIASLTLTIPAWISSTRRVNRSVDFKAVSSDAKQSARRELTRLKNEVEVVLHTIKKEG